MMDDRDVIRRVEGSAIVRAVDGVITRLSIAADHSLLLPKIHALFARAAARPGAVILSAAATHAILMAGLGRPVAWYWLILPAIYAAAGVWLLAMVDPRAGQRD